jgi:membrane fusion protein (multidrug efflux system)
MSEAESGTSEDSGKSNPAPAVNRKKEISLLVGSLILAGILLVGIYAIWNYDREHPTTDDAFLQANYVWIKPQVGGQITKLSVSPNEAVRAGQVLFQIDPAQYQQRLIKAEKQLILVTQKNVADQASVNAIKAQIAEQESAIKTAEEYAKSYQKMEKKGAASKLGAVSYEDALATARARLLELQADLAQAVAELGADDVQDARIKVAQAEVDLAKLALQWTRVEAPADGIVTGMTLRVGDVVEPGQQLFPFIETDYWWVQANFVETAVAHVRPGMPARVKIDTYGDRRFKGIVESISSGTAAAFSLLPPQNTTGNWVKVTQRIPVRIRLLDTDANFPLRFGASATATIDTLAGPASSQAGSTTP